MPQEQELGAGYFSKTLHGCQYARRMEVSPMLVVIIACQSAAPNGLPIQKELAATLDLAPR